MTDIPNGPTFGSWSWWYAVFLPFVIGALKWVVDKLSGTNAKLITDQNNLISRVNTMNDDANTRMHELETVIKAQTQEIHDLNKKLQKLISQLVRAGITPAIDD